LRKTTDISHIALSLPDSGFGSKLIILALSLPDRDFGSKLIILAFSLPDRGFGSTYIPRLVTAR
jgi:hypothetical protein